MSSRALRKLQREREEQEQAKILQKESSESENETATTIPRPALNAFQMLGEEENSDEEIEETHPQEPSGVNQGNEDGAEASLVQSTPKRKSKKRKKKGKGKMKETQTEKNETDSDEIEEALRSLAFKETNSKNGNPDAHMDQVDAQLFRLLAVEAKHLIAINEMKRLFGNVVLENTEEEGATPRRRGRGPQNVDLGTALTARHSPVSKGQGLKGLALKRNPLMMGKEEWPQAPSGGLGMEMVEKAEDGTIEYRFTHSSIYQGTQGEFETCVASMDPQRLISMLMFNPYHISTLLQVSEIAKQQGDHSVAGDLLERTLFTFGRSVHSTFANSLSQGKARLDFRLPENREFWLACWRYIKDLGQRGTWRTAFEWAKLILSLDPEGDPYCVAMIIDQLAIRGGQAEQFLKLADHSFFRDEVWKDHPNIKISKALAQYRLKQAESCRRTLETAVLKYPWIFAEFYKELNLPNLPKSIWGKQPRTDRERFDMESYVLNSKDIWSLPDAVSLLVEVCETTELADNSTQNILPPNDTPISIDEARHTLLSNNPGLISLLPHSLTTMPSRSSDPLPPPDDMPSYDPLRPSVSSSDPFLEAAYADLPPDINPNDLRTPNTLTSFLSRVLPFLRRADPTDPPGPNVTTADSDLHQSIAHERAIFEEMLSQHDLTPDEIPLGAQRITDEDMEAQRAVLQRLYRLVSEQSNARREESSSSAAAGTGGAEAGAGASSSGNGGGLGFVPPIAPQETEFADIDNDTPGQQPLAPFRPWGLPHDSDEERESRLGIPRPVSSSGPGSPDSAPSSPQQAASPAPNPAPPPQSREALEQEAQSRTQHWLAGSGIQGLKAHLEQYPLTNPNNEQNWKYDDGHRLVVEYSNRLRELRNRNTREFLLKYALPQGTNREIKEMVEGFL